MRRLAVLSMHTSPLAQPGTGDGGGMNVYVRELSAALARSGVRCDVYTRAAAPGLPAEVRVEPGLVVHHVPAGPAAPVPKEELAELVEEFTAGVAADLVRAGDDPPVEVVHANYWLSGIAGHEIKHTLGLPLVSTFHTLDRVKAEASPEELGAAEPGRRSAAEAAVIGCSDAVLASCSVEADQLVSLYGASPSRIEIVPPGVDHAVFSPGDRRQARRALATRGLPLDGPLLLFVGRIQPLKGAEVAVRVLPLLDAAGVGRTRLAIVGGPSGPAGPAELDRLRSLAEEIGVRERVAFVPPLRHEMLSTYYRAADCCVVPSRSESFGLVALEAAACGTPVVASAVGGLTTLVEHGRTGFLVEGADLGEVARALSRILGDASLAARLGAAAARRARRYTWSAAAHLVARLYDDLVSRSLVECT